MPDPGLIAVRTEVVLDTLVGSIAETVTARLDEPLPEPVEEALSAAGGEPRLVRMGFCARAVENERFERARAPMPWLADARLTFASAAEAARALAASEPTGRPDPGDEHAVSWKVPGPGGHVRHYLALRAATDAGVQPGADAKRDWLTGFLVHCLFEAAAPDVPSVR